uniref:Mediator of RNA polymerase II transcription subunit 22 n=1 Tax=Calidris pygmaea TaxID=425635 RepID=A0A8C3PJW5_9CHAR
MNLPENEPISNGVFSLPAGRQSPKERPALPSPALPDTPTADYRLPSPARDPLALHGEKRCGPAAQPRSPTGPDPAFPGRSAIPANRARNTPPPPPRGQREAGERSPTGRGPAMGADGGGWPRPPPRARHRRCCSPSWTAEEKGGAAHAGKYLCGATSRERTPPRLARGRRRRARGGGGGARGIEKERGEGGGGARVAMAQQRVLPQSKETLLQSYNKRLKDDVKSIMDNFTEIIKTAKIEDETQVSRATQGEQDNYEMHVRAANIVRAGESLMKLVSDLKQFLILNDFPSVNEAINQRNQQLRSLQEECDKKLIALRDEISIDLYELEEEYYSSSI